MLTDVCRVLEIGNPTMTKQRLNKNGVNSIEVIDNLGRPQQATFINGNLYKLAFTSSRKRSRRIYGMGNQWYYLQSESMECMTSSVAQQAINNPTEFLAELY